MASAQKVLNMGSDGVGDSAAAVSKADEKRPDAGLERIPGKEISNQLYVHKDYVQKSRIPLDLHDRALRVLREKFPDFDYTIVKHNQRSNAISFLHSPDWDTAQEPMMDSYVVVRVDGEAKKVESNTIYHQRWLMVGDDYTGFDVGESKRRTKQYQDAIREIACEKGIPTRQIYNRIGNPGYWNREIIPRITHEVPSEDDNTVTGPYTAIHRKIPPEPLKWLRDRGLIHGRSLDYGTGHGPWYDMEGYDPFWLPNRPTGKYDVITCVYVLNVISEKEQIAVLRDIRGLLKPDGVAYIVVRRDIDRGGQAGRGTAQRYVELPLTSINKNSGREIYELKDERRSEDTAESGLKDPRNLIRR